MPKLTERILKLDEELTELKGECVYALLEAAKPNMLECNLTIEDQDGLSWRYLHVAELGQPFKPEDTELSDYKFTHLSEHGGLIEGLEAFDIAAYGVDFLVKFTEHVAKYGFKGSE